MIENAFDKKIETVTKNISLIDLQILKLETNMEILNKRHHQINSQTSMYDVQKNIFQNYDEEKLIVNKKCKELIQTIDLAHDLRKIYLKIKNGRDLATIKEFEVIQQRKKEEAINKLNSNIEINLKNL